MLGGQLRLPVRDDGESIARGSGSGDFVLLGRGRDSCRGVVYCRILDEGSREAAVVDPVEPEKVLQVAREAGADVKLVLTTHHHWFCPPPPLPILPLHFFRVSQTFCSFPSLDSLANL